MAKQFYVRDGLNEIGPIDAEHLLELANHGLLNVSTLIREAGSQRYYPASEVKGLPSLSKSSAKAGERDTWVSDQLSWLPSLSKSSAKAGQGGIDFDRGMGFDVDSATRPVVPAVETAGNSGATDGNTSIGDTTGQAPVIQRSGSRPAVSRIPSGAGLGNSCFQRYITPMYVGVIWYVCFFAGIIAFIFLLFAAVFAAVDDLDGVLGHTSPGGYLLLALAVGIWLIVVRVVLEAAGVLFDLLRELRIANSISRSREASYQSGDE